jgi:RNase adapter protein RapZ
MSAPPSSVVNTELVIITGLSGSGKGTVLKAFEDLGYYSVDNLPIDLIPKFAELTKSAPNIRRAALVVDIREGSALERLPDLYKKIRRMVPARLVFLEAEDAVLQRRFSETRRPHPLGTKQSVSASIRHERDRLEAIRKIADPIINTSNFNVHELRDHIHSIFGEDRKHSSGLLVQVNSFGFRHGIPRKAIWCLMFAFCRIRITFPSSKKRRGSTPVWLATSGAFRRRRSSLSASAIC